MEFEKALELVIKDIVDSRLNIEECLCELKKCNTKKKDKCYECIKKYYIKRANV